MIGTNSDKAIDSQAAAILEFWFGTPGDADWGKPRKIWFRKKASFDAMVRDRFNADCNLAAEGVLAHWQEDPNSCLALILLLDQFPRNIFRGTPRAFATDAMALQAAERAVGDRFDEQLLPVQRWFLYLPFEHSEHLEHQHRSVALFETLADDPDSASTIDYADRHLRVIERFGRFPHRNAILGRESTPEEQEFLQQPGSGF